MDIPGDSLIAALLLAGAYAFGAWLAAHGAEEGFWSRRRWISAAAGISVAYVFVDVLPELAAHHRTIIEGAGEASLLFAEQRLYILALLSFVLFYGLEYIVLASGERRRGTAPHGEAGISPHIEPIYLMHLAGFAAYSALVGYLLVERAERGVTALALYTLAMGVHFLIVDHSLSEQHGERYERRGRWLITASVLAGWLGGAAAELPEAALARLFAILAGGVVITSLRAELPDDRRGRFWPFCIAAIVFALVLMLAG